MEKDKRYLVFVWNDYYPRGFANDKVASFDELEQAIDCLRKKSHYDRAYLYDRINGVEINIDQYKLDFKK